MSKRSADDQQENEPSENRTKRQKIDRTAISLQRWKLLREVLMNGHSSLLTSQNSVSVRRFKSFGLLQTSLVPYEKDDKISDGDWYKYSCSLFPDFSILIRHLPGLVKPETLLGFNNTGNVCVWPSEEVLTYYCLKHPEKFRDKRVIELGGGMTCLAGVALGVATDVSHVELTDGNEESVSNLSKCIERNCKSIGSTTLSSRMLRWGPKPVESDLKGKFDLVICADCLFFDAGRDDLVTTIHDLLKTDGEAILVAPKRGDTFDAFVSLVKKTFTVDVQENFDNELWNIHCKMKAKGIEVYDADIHYPWYIHLKKRPETRESSSER